MTYLLRWVSSARGRSGTYRLSAVATRPLADPELNTSTIASLLRDHRTGRSFQLRASHFKGVIEAKRLTAIANTAEFTLHMVPVGAAADYLWQGNYREAAISLAGDTAMFLGAPWAKLAVRENEVFTTTKALNNIQKMGKAAVGLEGGIAVVRTGQGMYAVQNGGEGAAGYFGEAVLRLFGVAAQFKNAFTKLDDAATNGTGSTIDLSRSVGAARQVVNWRSNSFFGHTFNQHGMGPKITRRLTGRAGGTGQPQGQWLDNQRAAEFLNDLPNIGEAASVRIPQGLGRVIMPDGSFVNAEWARVVVSPSGFRTAFPIIP